MTHLEAFALIFVLITLIGLALEAVSYGIFVIIKYLYRKFKK